MDEIKARLKNTSEECMTALDGWASDKKDQKARGVLNEAIHELRKVASRLEIELAISERNESQKPLPIPSHRDSQRRGGRNNDKGRDNNGNGNQDDNKGNSNNDTGNGNSDLKKSLKPRRQRRTPKKDD